MLVKRIRLHVRAGRLADFLRAQDGWTRAMESFAGFHGLTMLSSAGDAHRVELNCWWSDRAALDRFMRERHDQLEAESDIGETYDRIEVEFLESGTAAPETESSGGAWRSLALTSEAYRCSIGLRLALGSGMVDALVEERRLEAAAARCRLQPLHARKLANLLLAMKLFTESEGEWQPTAAASPLLAGAASPVRHLYRHNAHPELIDRWNRLEARLGVEPPRATHQDRLLAAMDDIAASGQAAAIAELILGRSRPARLLDIGGATGGNAIALASHSDSLAVDLLDLPASEAGATSAIAGAGLGDRIRFMAGDYRAALPPGPYDAILLANVLRGETPDQALELLRRCGASLGAGGAIWIVDLLGDGSGDDSDLMAAMFGLHLPDAIVPSVDGVEQLLGEAGYGQIEPHRIHPARIANVAILARPG